MKQLSLLFIATILIASCSKNNLKSEFNCKNSSQFSELKQYRDILKKFKIKLPSAWKTSLYYDDYSSEVFSADTTKGPANSYILQVSWKQGEITLDDNFYSNLIDTLKIKQHFKTIKTGIIKFKENESLWNLSEGNELGYTIHLLQVYVKTEIDEYLVLTTKIYGNTNIDERLCESIDLFNNIEILN